MDKLSLQEARKIAAAIRNGKSYYFEDYQHNSEGIFFKDGFFYVEHYHLDFREYKKETIHSEQLDEEQIVVYLLKKTKHYFSDFLKN